METNLRNRVRNLRFQRISRLTPLFEAISNSLHAIGATQRADGKLTILLTRQDQSEMPSPIGEGLGPIKSIMIVDNGEGFTDRNFKAFEELDTGIKQQLGSKGIGRLFWLKVFESAEISSVFERNNKPHRRTFTFRLPNGIENEKVDVCGKSEAQETKVTLTGVKKIFLKSYKLDVEAVKEAILNHFMSFFVTQFVPDILIKDDDGNKTRINANNLPDADEERFEIANIGFRLIHMKLPIDATKSHAVYFCAADRVVKSRSISDLLGNFTKRAVHEDGQSYYYAGYVLSDELTASVAAERDEFEIEERTEDLFGDNAVSWQQIEDEVAQRVEARLSVPLNELRQARDERVERVFANTIPELSYLRRASVEELGNISLDASEKDIALNVNRLHFEKRQSAVERLDATIDSLEAKDVGDFEAFRSKFADEILALSEVGQADLSAYMIYRQRVLAILLRAVQFSDEEEGFEKEKVVHSLFFPRFQDSEGAKIYDGHNLWLIDEALAFESYIASDVPLAQHKLLISDATARPDIVAYGLHFGISTPARPFDHITIIEFKRPGRRFDAANPITQIYDYIDEIRAGKVRDLNGLEVKANASTQFVGVILCDVINERVKKAADREKLQQEADGLSWHGSNASYNLYLRIVAFRQVYEQACLRHQKFFERLGLVTGATH